MKKDKTKHPDTRFRAIYEALPKKAFLAPRKVWIAEMCELVKVHPTTVRCWLAGAQRPDPLRTAILAKHLGVKPEELFAKPNTQPEN